MNNDHPFITQVLRTASHDDLNRQFSTQMNMARNAYPNGTTRPKTYREFIDALIAFFMYYYGSCISVGGTIMASVARSEAIQIVENDCQRLGITLAEAFAKAESEGMRTFYDLIADNLRRKAEFAVKAHILQNLV